jgi:hypothetical protein
MHSVSIKLATLAFAVLALAGCPADQAAVDPPGGPPVDMRPDPRIDAAPAMPTPPGEVPIGLQPTDSPRPMVNMDTIQQPGMVRPTPGTTPQTLDTVPGGASPRRP